MSNIIASPIARPPSDIPKGLVHDFLFNRIEKCLSTSGDYVWMEDVATGMKVNLSEVIPNSRKVASALTKRGFHAGDIVVFYVSNYPHMFYVAFAAWQCGGGVCPTATDGTADQLVTTLLDCKARVIVCDPHTKAKAIEARKRSPHVKTLIILGDDTGGDGVETLASYLEDDGRDCPENVPIDEEKDAVYFVYSSGTTGVPKGITHCHRSLMGMLTQYHPAVGHGANVLQLNWFYHMSGFAIAINWIALEYKFSTLSSYTKESLLKTINDKKPFLLTCYPHHVGILARDPLVDKYDCSSIGAVFTGGAVLPTSVEDQVKKRLPNLKAVTRVYAMAECLAISNTIPVTPGGIDFTGNMLFSGGCLGFIAPYAQIKVIDANGVNLGPGAKGEICVRSPCNTMGYLNKPEATARAFDEDGFLHTGDIGYFDKQGCLFFVEREKELLKYMIHHVIPGSLEAILVQHPAVADVAVAGLPDDIAGDIPIAFVVRNAINLPNVTAEEIEKFVADRVSDYERLRGGVHFVDEIPRNANGKLQRKVLISRHLETLTKK